MGNEDNGLTLLFEGPDDVHELIDFLRREHGCRLIEDDDVRVGIEGLEDLNPLLLADGDVIDLRPGIYGESVTPA